MEVGAEKIESLARQSLADTFPPYLSEDRVLCQSTPIAFELDYYGLSRQQDAESENHMKLFLYPNDGIVWIANLFICSEQRGIGMGRRLVDAAEHIALRLESPLIRVHPMYDAVEFWTCLGYHSAYGSARIQEKRVSKDSMSLDSST